jgi:magnesium-transporting ATPase (P-type)
MTHFDNLYQPPSTPLVRHRQPNKPAGIWFMIFFVLSILWLSALIVLVGYTIIRDMPEYSFDDLGNALRAVTMAIFFVTVLFALVQLLRKNMWFLCIYYAGAVIVLMSRFARDLIAHQTQTLFWGLLALALFLVAPAILSGPLLLIHRRNNWRTKQEKELVRETDFFIGSGI